MRLFFKILNHRLYYLPVLFFLVFFPQIAFSLEDQEYNIQLEQRLIDSGWKRTTAASVIRLNLAYFTMLEEEDPGKLDLTISRLQRLGSNIGLMSKLNEYPELAGLLAGADNPWDIANSFPTSECYGAVAGMYQLLITPQEQQDLADALNRHGRIICELANYGMPMPASIFMFDHNQLGAKEYAAWLEQVLKHSLSSSTPLLANLEDQADSEISENPLDPKEQVVIENLSLTMSIIMDQGPMYRERMRNDARFKNNFRQSLWPAFVRLTDCSRKPEGECDTPFDLLIQESRVWDLLMLEDGEILLDRWGLLAVELLVDDPNGDSFPKDLRPVAKEAMLSHDFATLSTLIRPLMRDEPMFRELMLRKDLDLELREQVLADLAKTCPEDVYQCLGLAERLRQLLSYDPATLREELGPAPSGVQTWLPMYSTYYLAKKVVSGRPVDTMDLVLASTDILFLATMTMGPVPKLIKPAAKNAAKEVAKTTAKNAAKKMANDQVKGAVLSSLEKLALQGRLAVAVAKKHLRLVMKQANKLNKSIDKSFEVNVTPIAQWVFEKTGIGRETMKKLTGLEARVFMRQNGRAVVNPKNNKILREIAENALGETVSETDVTKEVIKTATTKGLETKASLDAWRQHASSWWLANATGTL
jgi:hypothetical protein